MIHHSACRGRPASRSRARNQFSATSSLLNGALRINPFDVARTAAALDAALRMEPGEREGRRARDLDHVSSRPSALWTRQILDDMWTVCGRPAGAAGGGDGDTSRVLIADPDDGLGGNSGVGLREVRASLACACVARCVSCVCVWRARRETRRRSRDGPADRSPLFRDAARYGVLPVLSNGSAVGASSCTDSCPFANRRS